MKRLIWILLVSLPALSHGQKLLDSLKRNVDASTNDSTRAYWLNQRGFIYRQFNKDSALSCNNQAAVIAVRNNLRLSARNFEQTRGEIFDHVGDLDSAIAIYRRLLRNDTVQFTASAGWVLNRLGTLDTENGYFDRALTFLLGAMKYRARYNPGAEVETLGQMALLHNANHNYKDAYASIWKAKALLKDQPAEVRFLVYNALGMLCNRDRKYDSAMYYVREGYVKKSLPDNSPVHGNYQHSVGLVTESRNDKWPGLALLREALKVKKKYNSLHSIILTEYQIGEVFFEIAWEEKNPRYLDSAMIHIAKVLQYAEAKKNIRLLKNTTGLASDIYAGKGDLPMYYKYKNPFMNLTDSLFNRRRDAEMVRFEKKYQLKEKETENLLLSNEVQRQNYFFMGAIVAILLIATILYTVYRSNVKTQALNKQIEASNKTKDRLFSIISHDLRGPIAAFETTPKILRSYVDKNQPEKINEMVEHIDRSARSINQLLDNLLNWSLSQKEELVINIEKLSIKPIMDEIIAMFKDAARLKGIVIECTITEQHVMADRNTFSTVVRNLLSNAIKFSHRNSVITIGHRITDNWIEFKFSDSGTGMSEDQLSKLFDIDKSKVRMGTAKEKGTGLGMVLVKEFVEINKGHIKVESKPEIGTTFYLSLPMAS
jgi:signal transduction histidine kinase